jgi:hypothetical protein
VIGAERLRYRSAITVEVLRSPRIELRLSSSATARRRHRQLSAAHPTLKVVSAGGFGAALMPVPASLEDYLRGGSRALLRRKRRLALDAGLTFTAFYGPDRLDDILAIHRSAPVRQSQPMHSAYLDERAVGLYAERAGQLLGVVDGAGTVCAYAHTETQGEVGSFQRLIGHSDALDAGAVYLLASEVVGRFMDAAADSGLPRWLMCGSLWGNSPGLAYFKRRVGFKPYRARFILQEPQPLPPLPFARPRRVRPR